MLGIGLGSFVEGFTKGYGLKQDMEDRAQAQTDRAEDRKWRAEDRAIAQQDRTEARQMRTEDRAYQGEERDFARSERDRTLGQRDAIDQIGKDARTEFAAGVEAGTYDPKQFDQFWTDYALPKMRSELLLQGDTAGAKALSEWGDSEAAKKGGRLFSSAMFKVQSGDAGGALDDVIEAGKVQGYIDHNYEIGQKEPIMDEAGKLVGYRLTITQPGGDTLEQDIALDDIPSVISSFANPQAAWASQQAARADKSKRAADIEDHRQKAVIDAETSGTKGAAAEKRRAAAIKTLRDKDPLASGADALPFDELDRAEQERQIADEMALQVGGQGPVVPSSRVIVDTQSGNPVPSAPTSPTPNPAAVSAAPGLGAAPKPAARNAVVNGREDPGLAAPPTLALPAAQRPGQPPQATGQAAAIDRAAQLMVEGGSPQEAARHLTEAGVPPEKWPGAVRLSPRMSAAQG